MIILVERIIESLPWDDGIILYRVLNLINSQAISLQVTGVHLKFLYLTISYFDPLCFMKFFMFKHLYFVKNETNHKKLA